MLILPQIKVNSQLSILILCSFLVNTGSAGKESTCNAGDLGSIPGLGRYPGEGKGYPLQYSGLENSMDCIVHGVAKCQTRLTHFHFLCFLIGFLCCGIFLVFVSIESEALMGFQLYRGSQICLMENQTFSTISV